MKNIIVLGATGSIGDSVLSVIKQNENKLNSLQYILTPKGINERMQLTLNFMRRKIKEYDELKKEFEQSKFEKKYD